jgi:hypothetical protein
MNKNTCIGLLAAALMLPQAANARVIRIVIESRSLAFNGASFGTAGQYEILTGHAIGELDPKDTHNRIIQDIALARKNARGLVEYSATFQLVKPLDITKSSHLLWHDVPNRGGRLTIVAAERNTGDIGLSSGWQGDASGATAPGPNRETVTVPVARAANGAPITGRVLARLFNVSGPASQPMLTASNPVPYKPASLDTRRATLTTHASETIDGKIGRTATIAPADWAWGRCDAAHPFPGTPDPTQVCLRRGFDPSLLYQLVFTAQDPPVLGIGLAAFRDLGSFFRYAERDDAGTPNPVAGGVQWVIGRGQSQSGHFLRQYIHLGFNQDEANRKIQDGAWPIIAGRRLPLNTRFAQPDGVLTLYQPGSEGPQWWLPAPDPVRGLPALGILDRCGRTNTCPKIIEHFGAAEVWGLKLTPEWVGTDGKADLPLPDSVRRYYVASTQHGGGPGGFSVTPAAPPVCPGTNWGRGLLAANPMPQLETVNAMRVHFRDWVMRGVAPPPSRYPRLADGTLVDASKTAMGFPTLPGLPADAPNGYVNPVLDYDFGPGFNRADGGGIASRVPPTIRRVIAMKVPRVDADGNEVGGVPVALLGAPLGTYLGWNVTASGFFAGRSCNYAGGMIPFARTRAERVAAGDPRPSLEERYGDHDGYVRAVRRSADAAMAAGFLLDADATALVAQAEAGNVLK